MTQQRALKEAQERWGAKAAVQVTSKGGRIGAHGEYLPSHIGNNRKDDLRQGMYWCAGCSSMEPDGDGNVIERRVWHPLGGWQSAYKVGVIALGMFFEVRAEADSFEAAFEKLGTKAAA